MLKDLLGHWKLVESENYDAIYQKLGLNWFVRMLAANGKPDIEWVALEVGTNGEPVLLQQRTLSECRPSAITFRIGEAFEDKAFDGRKIRSAVALEGSQPLRLVRKSTGDSEVKLSTTWELQADGTLHAVFQVDSVIAKRRYEKKSAAN